ncbi:hypothetical protein EYZ11_012810 [Aspergillus tanneri]|uniref:Uncharacterized protein n=1 Tax=Aspergillus tanneri TaxID=1220188 RepID=A0A4S3IZS9_9EURO|nr:hypothetical protein EYZ11_012810 [Aspergillus tanneri]
MDAFLGEAMRLDHIKYLKGTASTKKENKDKDKGEDKNGPNGDVSGADKETKFAIKLRKKQVQVLKTNLLNRS